MWNKCELAIWSL